MLLVYVVVAIVAGFGTGAACWPILGLFAVLAAPFGASLAVLLVGLGLVVLSGSDVPEARRRNSSTPSLESGWSATR